MFASGALLFRRVFPTAFLPNFLYQSNRQAMPVYIHTRKSADLRFRGNRRFFACWEFPKPFDRTILCGCAIFTKSLFSSFLRQIPCILPHKSAIDRSICFQTGCQIAVSPAIGEGDDFMPKRRMIPTTGLRAQFPGFWTSRNTSATW